MLFFVKRMGSHRELGAPALVGERLHHKALFVHGAHHAVLGGAGHGAQSGALQNFSHVIAVVQREAVVGGDRSEGAGIVGAAAHHQLCSALQGL